jgi:hypothetical protein
MALQPHCRILRHDRNSGKKPGRIFHIPIMCISLRLVLARPLAGAITGDDDWQNHRVRRHVRSIREAV